ncbi:MAG: leucine-rich repeat domain-containing protein [Saprospiraceae bacterium]
MNKKLIFILGFLALLQVGIYFTMNEYGWKINEMIGGRYVPDEEGIVDLTNRTLRKVPREIFRQKNIKTLQISNISLTEFPYEVLSMPNLEKLYIGRNDFESIDFQNAVTKSTSIKQIYCSNCNLYEIKNLDSLPNLEVIDLGYNNLDEIPNLNFPNLKEIDLSNNNFRNINSSLLPSGLEVLTLSGNPLEVVPYNILTFQNLQELHLRNCMLSEWTTDTIINTALHELSLDNNLFTVFDINLNDIFPNLIHFSITHCSLNQFYISHNNLQYCHIGYNDSTSTRINMPNLQTLGINFIQLKNQLNKIQSDSLQKIELDIYPNNNEAFLAEFYEKFPNVEL